MSYSDPMQFMEDALKRASAAARIVAYKREIRNIRGSMRLANGTDDNKEFVERQFSIAVSLALDALIASFEYIGKPLPQDLIDELKLYRKPFSQTTDNNEGLVEFALTKIEEAWEAIISLELLCGQETTLVNSRKPIPQELKDRQELYRKKLINLHSTNGIDDERASQGKKARMAIDKFESLCREERTLTDSREPIPQKLIDQKEFYCQQLLDLPSTNEIDDERASQGEVAEKDQARPRTYACPLSPNKDEEEQCTEICTLNLECCIRCLKATERPLPQGLIDRLEAHRDQPIDLPEKTIIKTEYSDAAFVAPPLGLVNERYRKMKHLATVKSNKKK